MTFIDQLDHLVLTCVDLAATKRFYVAVLQMQVETFGEGRTALKFGNQKINIAPAITNASDGSHRPARSRNPSTFAGLAMPDTVRPTPNRRPESKAVSKPISASQQMSGHEYSQTTACHECCRRDKRTDGAPRDTTDTVAAGATARVTRADANQKACDDYLGPPSLYIRRYRVPKQTCQHRCSD